MNGSNVRAKMVIAAPRETGEGPSCPKKIVNNPRWPQLALSDYCIYWCDLFPCQKHARFSCPIDTAIKKSSAGFDAVERMEMIVFRVNLYGKLGDDL